MEKQIFPPEPKVVHRSSSMASWWGRWMGGDSGYPAWSVRVLLLYQLVYKVRVGEHRE